jgi:hypothetical protein
LKNRKGPVMMERFYEATRLSTDWKGLLWTVAGACWDESWEALPTPPPFSYTTACWINLFNVLSFPAVYIFIILFSICLFSTWGYFQVRQSCHKY